MGSFHFISEDPTDTSSRYAGRIPQPRWERHKPIIRRFHETGLTRRQILNELKKHNFHPSFGQLVAQMTKWRFIRYSKPSFIDASSSSSLQAATILRRSPQLAQSGILRLARLLQDNPKFIERRAASITSQNVGLPVSQYEAEPDGHSNLVTGLPLEINLSEQIFIAISGQEISDRYQGTFGTAELLFAGESYSEAFGAFLALARSTCHKSMTIDDEQRTFQAIVGCLKSATDEGQHRCALRVAQDFLDIVVSEGPNSNISIGATDLCRDICKVFKEWHSRDCAVAKVVFDLLTVFKKSRKWQTSKQTHWAHETTLREWTYSRLIRLPSWEVAVPFLNNSPLSQINASSVFDHSNINAIISWTGEAITCFKLLFASQVQELAPWTSQSVTPARVLLLWRLLFFSKHSQAQSCPLLRLHLSHETTFIASERETAAVMARLLMPDHSFIYPRFVLEMVWFNLKSLEELVSKNEIASHFWTALRAVLVPTFDERQRSRIVNAEK